jgi:hypothetical protein
MVSPAGIPITSINPLGEGTVSGGRWAGGGGGVFGAWGLSSCTQDILVSVPFGLICGLQSRNKNSWVLLD